MPPSARHGAAYAGVLHNVNKNRPDSGTGMKIVFSDLDGTLLDADTYSFDKAREGLQLLRRRDIPLVICTSKTRSEIMHWRRRIGNDHPFISENGGGIFIPQDYFGTPVEYDRTKHGFQVIELGVPYQELTAALDELAERFDIRGFHDMTPAELAQDAGLSLDEARRAMDRDYDEPFILGNPGQTDDLRSAVQPHGLQLVRGGRYLHLTGGHDKGRAVRILTTIYGQENPDVVTMGIGDSPNDFPMLDAVNRPYLVARPDASYASDAYPHAGATGPTGWAMVARREASPD